METTMNEKENTTEAVEKNTAPKSARITTKIKNAFSPEKRKKSIIVLVFLLLVIALSCFMIHRNSPASIAKRFAIAWAEGDEKTENKLYAYDQVQYTMGDDIEAYLDQRSKNAGEDFQSLNQYYKYLKNATQEELEDNYGKYKITARVSVNRDISLKKLEKYVDFDKLESSIGFDRDMIKKGKAVIVKLKISGEDDIVRVSRYIYLGKVKGKWGVLAANYYDYDYYNY